MRQQSWGAKYHRLLPASVVCALLISGCETIAPVVLYPAGITPPRTIAVLPFVNETNSVPAARSVRKTMHEDLLDKGYIALEQDQVDQVLSSRFGISLGEQISDNVIPEIGKTLKVDAVVTGVVKKFARVDFFQNKIESEAIFVIHEVETGERLWQYQAYGWQEVFPPKQAQGGPPSQAVPPPPPPRQGVDFYKRLFCAIPTGAAPQRPHRARC
jgi:hypothetical protein